MGKGATTRRYTEEFKRDAVALLRSSGRSIAEVAKQLGVTDTSLGSWAREEATRAGVATPRRRRRSLSCAGGSGSWRSTS
jgi:transposase